MTNDALVEGYLAHFKAVALLGRRSPEAESTQWAWDEVERQVRQDWDQAFQTIRSLVAKAPDGESLAFVAAGPLEDLLCQHGDQFIEPVEALAAGELKFRAALASVWGRGRMSSAIRARVDVAAGLAEKH